jgi:hypothetical protein
MSQTDELGKLAITAGAGIVYRVVDAFGNEFGRGSGAKDFELPEGLYAVQWLSGGEQSETLMRVQKGTQSEARNVPAEDPGSEKPAGKIARASRVVSKLRPSEISYGSAIAIVITSTHSRDSREALKSFRLFDRRDVAMRSSENGVPEIVLRSGELARCYQVPPGRFRLAYMSHTGETVEQSIPALKGRQTIIFLEAVRGRVLVVKGSGFVKVQRSGIDAARTVLVSVKGDEDDTRIRERFRLTELLLRDLAGAGAALTDDFCSILEKRSVDPLLRLAAATVVIARLNAGKSPALDRAVLNELSSSGMRNEWLRRATSWLPRSRLGSWPSDATIAWWEMERLGSEGVVPPGLPRTITVPPMFACAWRWAMARSTTHPEAIARNAAMRAAEGGSSAEPWLCWKGAAAKGQSPLPAYGVERDSNEFAALLAEKVRATLGGGSDSGFRVDPFSVLGPDNGALALALHQGPQETTHERRPSTLAESVASALAIPG